MSIIAIFGLLESHLFLIDLGVNSIANFKTNKKESSFNATEFHAS